MGSKKLTPKAAPKLTKAEEDLLGHLERGYQLESGPLGSDPVLRNLKDDSVVRATSANQGTIKALEGRGLIQSETEGLTTIWRSKGKSGRSARNKAE
jgi:hypothetical protein